ncbi:beta-ketoacyl-[acyl-carrier-protein] synthase family protein [Desulfurivibrio dismutans]|uniref:beta-ketoacyl-[acyl-carrier-protein] synthase family protein n=1 Tax=Desulfurivibrio dismutans TaxID=1398908 RepID=UPI0023D9E365|nr:beta-ketoacyl synthase N-terminal-like domain-containing protein [Desulfurivibrio alkaliphilus]MDF1614717.1 beta-ketoacyl synthase N-terminal-like domain-containing protein [Desulfurivibrio alkaliphilus]
MSLNRVVITGCGAISPYGQGVAALVDGVWASRATVQAMPEWGRIDGLHSLLAAPVPELAVKELLSRNLRRTMGPMAIYATLAAREAVAQAALNEDYLASGEVGVAVGSTTGSPSAYEDFYRRYLPDEAIDGIKSGEFFKIMGHSCAANVCLALGIRGEQWAPVSACASSCQAIGLGYLLIKSGRQQAMLCGGADEVHPSVTGVFDVVRAASQRNGQPASSPRPFDRDRDGVVCGGGSGILVLENYQAACARGATILGEIIGFGNVSDSEHIANPHEDAMAGAMRKAMAEAGVEGSQVDYVNAHATGTLQGDLAEARAIGMVLGPGAAVSSCKGHIGHTLGAAAALESIVVLEMLRRQEAVPTLNLENPDPECAVVDLIKKVEKRNLNMVLKNNFALGGVNSALVIRRQES